MRIVNRVLGMLPLLLLLGGSAFGLSASGVAMTVAPPTNTIMGTVPTESRLHTGPDTLCTAGHYRDSLLLLSAFTPKSKVQYVLKGDTIWGRYSDSVSWAIEVTAFTSYGTICGRMTDTTITSTAPWQFVLPFYSQIMGKTFNVCLKKTAATGADSTNPQIFKGVYLDYREPMK